jgi:FkbM family methyltransferase
MPFDAPRETNCPSKPWIDAMIQSDPVPDKIIIDVGCNKGDDAIEWMERWDPSGSEWSKAKWVNQLQRTLNETGNAPTYCCGPPRTTGYQKAASFAASEGSGGQANLMAQGSPIGVCVEPMETTVDLLLRVQHSLGYDLNNQKHGAFHVVAAALSDKADYNSTIDFPDGTAGIENAGIVDSHNRNVKAVALSTVDNIVADLQLPRVDILTMDTEGHDPVVLLGASAALATVRYLEFEVHRDLGDTAWGSTTLGSVVHKLDALGLDCYWAGNHGSLLSMNRCWGHGFEKGVWGNAACVRRDDKWWDVLEQFARPPESTNNA